MRINPKRILIIKPSSLGDIIHALPTLVALRTRFPEAWITWMVKEEWAEILEDNPYLNEVLAVNFSLSRGWSLLQAVRERRFDLVIDLQGLFRSGCIARLSGAPVVVGFAQGREGSPWWYTHRVELPIPKGESWRLWNMHAVDRNLEVAKFLGAECMVREFWLPSRDEDREVVDRWFRASGIVGTDRLIAMAPVTRQAIKNWPLERFIQVAHALIKISHVKIVLIGTEDSEVSRSFEGVIGSGLVNLMGKTRVRQLSVLFDRVQLVIANDSAPLHIAVARGTPIVTVFGPTNPEATGPYGRHQGPYLLTSPISCRPCGQRTCRNDRQLECLTSISVSQVVSQAERLLVSGH
ncbi:glycosyltransferase family 9 protein [Candidatus Nitronereus thalassa]|uniref:Glycosyltransferase family 9 protein n=1 Tax=Candidatus Nitronereus thalassa TaxID=3020898 RepID=A0ABU3K627_9BACT|nr:glycosyltransferase family 9 protein [Candidatus Nitronereus thalassa]MDT7041810.1 glycosyltransferase family 9 protein [Candidatus Nitronereus thalassa]